MATDKKIEQNKQAREAAEELVGMGIELFRGMEPEQVRRAWEVVAKQALEIIGKRTPDEPKRKVGDRVQWRKAADDYDEMPFGKHKGTKMKNVPADYLDWLGAQPWIEEWPAILGYIEEHREEIDGHVAQ